MFYYILIILYGYEKIIISDIFMFDFIVFFIFIGWEKCNLYIYVKNFNKVNVNWKLVKICIIDYI